MIELRGRWKYLGHAMLIVACLLILFPFAWIVLTSIKNRIDIYSGTLNFVPTWHNYDRILFSEDAGLMVNVKNSAIVAVVSTLIVMILATLAAYGLSWFRWSRLISVGLLTWILMFQMMPHIALVGPWYLVFYDMGLYGSLLGLVLTHVTVNLPMAIWLMMSFLMEVPRELEEAALIDGCRRAHAFVRVVLPQVMPGLAACGILSFIFSWNEFAVALNLTTTSSATIPVGIAKFAQQYEVLYGEMAASAVVATIPAIVLVVFSQRLIVKGLTLGALK